MEAPEFPKEFCLNHCPLVLDAKDNAKFWAKIELSDEEALQFANCAFVVAGFGFTCEECKKHVSSVRHQGKLIEKQDTFYGQIRNFYEKANAYYQLPPESEKLSQDEFIGSGI